jgi:hypothetical protein
VFARLVTFGGSGKYCSVCNVPVKFDDCDFDAWLREFDACCAANGWKLTEANDEKIIKLPAAFLRGRAATNFW